MFLKGSKGLNTASALQKPGLKVTVGLFPPIMHQGQLCSAESWHGTVWKYTFLTFCGTSIEVSLAFISFTCKALHTMGRYTVS